MAPIPFFLPLLQWVVVVEVLMLGKMVDQVAAVMLVQVTPEVLVQPVKVITVERAVAAPEVEVAVAVLERLVLILLVRLVELAVMVFQAL
jgi:hypothetical protein